MSKNNNKKNRCFRAMGLSKNAYFEDVLVRPYTGPKSDIFKNLKKPSFF